MYVYSKEMESVYSIEIGVVPMEYFGVVTLISLMGLRVFTAKEALFYMEACESGTIFWCFANSGLPLPPLNPANSEAIRKINGSIYRSYPGPPLPL